jgi:hypothetical protein
MAKRKRKSTARNPFHDHPLMRKGGVHEKIYKAKRKGERQKLKKEWCSSIALEQCNLTTPLVVLVA